MGSSMTLVVILILIMGVTATLCSDNAKYNLLMGNEIADTRTRSVVLQLDGNIYPEEHFYVRIPIGSPERKQEFTFHVDTGSDITWLQCDADKANCSGCRLPFEERYKSSNNILPASDPLCKAFSRTSKEKDCPFDIKYLDCSRIRGPVVTDQFVLQGLEAPPSLAFGCGNKIKNGASANTSLTGLLGLQNSSASIVSQLTQSGNISKNVIGHCLGGQEQGGSGGKGFLFFGDDLNPSRQVQWTNMVGPEYATRPLMIGFGDKFIKPKRELHFDSGTTYAYLEWTVYEFIVDEFKNGLDQSKYELYHADPFLCITDRSRIPIQVDDLKKISPKLIHINFMDASVEIPPENYLIINEAGNACFAVAKQPNKKESRFSLMGANFMMNKLFIYDNENSRIGWTPYNCRARPPPTMFQSTLSSQICGARYHSDVYG